MWWDRFLFCCLHQTLNFTVSTWVDPLILAFLNLLKMGGKAIEALSKASMLALVTLSQALLSPIETTHGGLDYYDLFNPGFNVRNCTNDSAIGESRVQLK